MKHYAVLACFALAACGTSPAPKGAGFDSPTTTRTETVTYGQATPAGQVTRAPGWYQTPTGAPWYVVQSTNVKRGRAPLRGTPALVSASAYASSKWRAPHAKSVSTADGTGMFRLVTIDGVSIVVVKKLKTKSFWTSPKEELAGISNGAIRAAGCERAGNTMVRMANYSVQSTATPVRCKWQ